ncbi:MAG: CCA tRNA nucleotidyltransferase [Clostridia bacterium]|nr:CCA tRNA nucleotidyltransferase [Clostridia bacterium]
MLKIPLFVSEILDTLNTAGYDAYLVGGPVRDMLLGLAPKDYDITTNATPDIIKQLFTKTVDTGIKHGTVTVVTAGGNVEITTYRKEDDYSDFRHPKNVEYVSDLKTDLSRRDFTVNAIAYNEKAGVVDLFGGTDDLKRKTLKAVGDPKKRFSEDALRILRLYRFASTLSFAIEENTNLAALSLSNNLKNISVERIREEIKKAINGKNPSALSPLLKTNCLEFLSIKDGNTDNLTKLSPGIIRLFDFLENCTTDYEKAVKGLKLSSKEENYLFSMHKLNAVSPPENKEQIKRLLIDYSEVFPDYLLYKNTVKENTDKTKKLYYEITNSNEPYRISDLALTGEDLKNMGLKGEEIGKVLRRAQAVVIKNKNDNNKKTLLQILNID